MITTKTLLKYLKGLPDVPLYVSYNDIVKPLDKVNILPSGGDFDKHTGTVTHPAYYVIELGEE